MVRIKHKSIQMGKTLNIKSVMGSRVIAKNGKVVGNVMDIHLHPKKLSIEGIRVQKGKFLGGYIGKGYIKSITRYGVMLEIVPFTEYIGKKVLDNRGKKVGVVESIQRNKKTNHILSITVNRWMPGRKRLVIKAGDIAEAGTRIVLRKKIK
ncbi:MAG: PRC-barrel domain-containing protein [Candidatus Micrarchaeota archaeon]